MPKMRLPYVSFKKLKQIGSWIFNFIIRNVSLIINVFLLVISIVTLLVARNTLKSSNNQFNINSKTDSIHLQITNLLLEETKSLLFENMFSERPIISVYNNYIVNSYMKDGKYLPLIETNALNSGKRYATDVSFRCFVIYNNFRAIRTNTIKMEPIGPNHPRNFKFKPVIDLSSKEDFYYCYEIIYKDDNIDSIFVQPYYTHFKKDRGTFVFEGCTEYEVSRIDSLLNNILVEHNRRKFGDQIIK
ncbi:MAG: hypothetical protein ACOCWG_02245 [bacterium]